MQRIREVMIQPIKDEKGKLNHKLIDQQIKIWEKVENRVKGVTPQALNISQKSVNVNLNKNEAVEARRVPLSNDLDAIDAQIRELEGGGENITPLSLEESRAEETEVLEINNNPSDTRE